MADISKWWAWFDSVCDKAATTDDGKRFLAAGFTVTHTGGGCTAWERLIPGTDKAIMITDGNLGHNLTQEAIDYFGEMWTVGACSTENGSYAEYFRETAILSEALRLADGLQEAIQAGTVPFPD